MFGCFVSFSELVVTNRFLLTVTSAVGNVLQQWKMQELSYYIVLYCIALYCMFVQNKLSVIKLRIARNISVYSLFTQGIAAANPREVR